MTGGDGGGRSPVLSERRGRTQPAALYLPLSPPLSLPPSLSVSPTISPLHSLSRPLSHGLYGREKVPFVIMTKHVSEVHGRGKTRRSAREGDRR